VRLITGDNRFKHMTKKIITFLILVITSLGIQAQYDIKIDLDGYQNDTLIAGYYLGDRQLVLDTLYSQKEGQFRLKGDTLLNEGFYLLLTFPEKQILQFIIDNDQKFEISAAADDLAKVSFKGSKDNEVFMDYVNFIAEKKPAAEAINNEVDSLELDDPKRIELMAKLDAFDATVKSKQNEVIQKYPQSYTTRLVKANLGLDIPEFEGTEEENKKSSYKYYKDHYFDNMDLGDPANLRTSFIHDRINYYMTKLTTNHPDSIKVAVDYILAKMEPSPDTYQFYLTHFLNTYARAKIVGMDAVYVHLVDNYYAAGKAPWAGEELLTKLKDNSNGIRSTLIGEIAPDLTLFMQDGTPVTLSELEYEYLVLFFHKPDCGHCKKAVPDVVKFYEEYKDKGVKLLSICTELGQKAEKCWESIEDKNMGSFINVNDPTHSSRYKSKYYVRSTPKLFILDPDRKVLIKDIGANQLMDVMVELERRAAEESIK